MTRNTLAILERTGLFEGIQPDEAKKMLKCLGAINRRYSKGDYVFRRGDRTDCLGVVTEGCVRIVKEDYWGNRTVLSEVRTGGMVGCEYACSSERLLDVSVVAVEHSEVLFLDVNRIANVCTSSCEFHNRLVRNMIRILAHESVDLNQRLDQMSKRTTREKVCAFLSDQARISGEREFLVPLNRQQMADHLSVDRSAMSAELGRMKRDGLIEFSKNRFVLRRSQPSVPFCHELLEEADHVGMPVLGHLPAGRRAHHILQQQ